MQDTQEAHHNDPEVTASAPVDWARRARDLERLNRVGVALSAEQNKDRLIELILLEAKDLTRADGGTLYLAVENDAGDEVADTTQLHFAILRNDTLKVARGGTTGEPIDLYPVPLYDAAGRPNHKNVASYCATTKRSVNIADAYTEPGFDFSGTKAFDSKSGYRSQSFLTIPMLNNDGRVIGVLQLINARDDDDNVVAFDAQKQQIVEALASQAAIALNNQHLLHAQKALLESFIKLIANAIDAKSPYTGGHCTRVPIITELLARAACETVEGPLKDFCLSDDEWYELRIAAWLHDCGKVVTPVHVMDKATKLETIADRIHGIRARTEILKRDAELACLRRILADPSSKAAAEADCLAVVAGLDDDFAFLEHVNIGGEFLPPEQQARIKTIGARTITIAGVDVPLLSADELDNLCISRGTLTQDERLVINGHMVETIKMLEALPFPRHLRRVPEYAGGHHEKMDGGGYPRGLYGGDMSLPARIMAVADVFEALTAQDRPYKKAKSLSETMTIMASMKADNHLDPVLFDLFISSGVYRTYAEHYLPSELIDAVDEEALLAMKPRPFELPAHDVRAARKHEFLPAYRPLSSL